MYVVQDPTNGHGAPGENRNDARYVDKVAWFSNYSHPSTSYFFDKNSKELKQYRDKVDVT